MVQLVDEQDNPTGLMEKMAAHRDPHLHRAISVFILNSSGEWLLHQRSSHKYHSRELWSNACCTHPHWGEASRDCAVRRLREELGMTGMAPVFAETVEYRADVGGGMTEHEVVDIFTADAPAGLRVEPNPVEVMAVRWIALSDLQAEVAAMPECFTPWLKIYLAEHRHRIFRAA